MNRTLLEPEYFIYVRSRLNNIAEPQYQRADPQYQAFLKMVKADDEEFRAFLKKITMVDV